MPGKFARIQPSSRLALMSLIRRRLATSFSLNRSVQRLPSPPVSMDPSRPEILLAPVADLRYRFRPKFSQIPT